MSHSTESIQMDVNGGIQLCPSRGCGFKCCEFQQGNYIVMYPGEYENARDAGSSISHLKIINPDDSGGKRAVCTAANTANCDNGYKPLDCQSYPLFPQMSPDGDIGSIIKGEKCPLLESELGAHRESMMEAWTPHLAEPKFVTWLKNVSLVGYRSTEL